MGNLVDHHHHHRYHHHQHDQVAHLLALGLPPLEPLDCDALRLHVDAGHHGRVDPTCGQGWSEKRPEMSFTLQANHSLA